VSVLIIFFAISYIYAYREMYFDRAADEISPTYFDTLLVNTADFINDAISDMTVYDVKPIQNYNPVQSIRSVQQVNNVYGVQTQQSSIYNDPVTFAKTKASGRVLSYNDSTVPEEKEDIWVMYNLLNDADKNLYNFFLDLTENRNGENYKSALIISQKLEDQIGYEHMWKILHTMEYDHPEFFFFTEDDDIVDCYHTNIGEYKVYFFSMKAETEMDKEKINAFNAASSEFMKDIDLSLPKEEVELAIHDKLISLVSYDYDLLARKKIDSSINDLGHSAYGALVCNSSGTPHKAVCAGYAMAFEHLCHLAGIPCCTITGEATNLPATDDDNGHAWNSVYINGRWYEVDTTWDDFDYKESMDWGFYEALLRDSAKTFNKKHHYYNRTTAEMAYLRATEDTLFEIEGYLPYNAASDSTHIRYTEYRGDSNDVDVFRNLMIPIAE
jgi:hypothetical protein